MYQWCGFKSRRGKNKNLTALRSNSNTVWFNFQTYIYILKNLLSLSFSVLKQLNEAVCLYMYIRRIKWSVKQRFICHLVTLWVFYYIFYNRLQLFRVSLNVHFSFHSRYFLLFIIFIYHIMKRFFFLVCFVWNYVKAFHWP